MATIYLITGNVGAGKSTYADLLSRRENAHILAVDEWMRHLFLADRPDIPTYEWALERTERIEVQILLEAARLIKRKMSVVLDLGFFARAQRQRVQAYFRDQGMIVSTHYLDVDKETRWERVDHRNTAQTVTYQFDVSREVFEFCETIFEPLNEAEREDAIIVAEND